MWSKTVFVIFIIFVTLASAARKNKKPNRAVVYKTSMAREPIPAFALLVHNGSVACAGSLIHQNFVLTTAYCVDIIKAGQHPAKEIKVMLNVAKINPSNTGAVSRNVKGLWKHPRFSGYPNYYNDIGIIKLNSPVKNIKPIKLANKLHKYHGQKPVAFWFETSFAPKPSNALLTARSSVINNQECRQWARSKHMSSQQFLCTHPIKKICHADGVMMTGNTQIGMVSQTGCGAEYPDVSQRIGFHYKTIKSAIAKWKN